MLNKAWDNEMITKKIPKSTQFKAANCDDDLTVSACTRFLYFMLPDPISDIDLWHFQ